MATVNSLAKSKELLLHLEGYDTITAKLTSLAQQAEQTYLPLLVSLSVLFLGLLLVP